MFQVLQGVEGKRLKAHKKEISPDFLSSVSRRWGGSTGPGDQLLPQHGHAAGDGDGVHPAHRHGSALLRSQQESVFSLILRPAVSRHRDWLY